MTTYKQLDPEVKTKWLAALRSGEYTQTDGALGHRTNDEDAQYCCLGVLATACKLPGTRWRGEDYEGEAFDLIIEFGEDGNYAGDDIPLFLADIIGLDEKAQTLLISMNDGGESFEDIADWIEGNL